MSGKRRISSTTGKFLLDNAGKKKICTCCGDIPACACPNACWRWTITAVPAYDGECVDCAIWDYGAEFIPGSPLYECIPDCTDPPDFGFPVAYCRDGNNVYLHASLETAPPCADEACCPYYIGYSLATPLPLTAEGCPSDGTYTLDLDPLYDGEPCNIPQISVQIERIACCAGVADGSEPVYYVSFDSVFTYHAEPGTITDCLGTGGTEYCNTSLSFTDEPLSPVIGESVCYRISDNEFLCSIVGFSAHNIVLRNVDGDWYLDFCGDLCGSFPTEFTSVKVGGATPVGTYPDVVGCVFDGTPTVAYAFNVSITNIVVTA